MQIPENAEETRERFELREFKASPQIWDNRIDLSRARATFDLIEVQSNIGKISTSKNQD